MKEDDDFSRYFRDALEERYDYVDRIVLNGYFSRGHSGGGFRTRWRDLTDSDETLDQEHLVRMAGRFSRRVHHYANDNGLALIHCAAGERKHRLAEKHLPKDPNLTGLFSFWWLRRLRWWEDHTRQKQSAASRSQQALALRQSLHRSTAERREGCASSVSSRKPPTLSPCSRCTSAA